MKLDDKQIREVLKERLSTYKDCYIYDEFTLPSGKSRADLVAVNGHFTAYEIKSDFDSLKRLLSQVKEYDKVFEKNYIVIGKKFINQIEPQIPKHWGIILASTTRQGKITLNFVRIAKLNPNFSFHSFLYLLSSNQIKYLAKELPNYQKIYKRTDSQAMMKQDIVTMINSNASKKQQNLIKNLTRQIFKGYDIRNLYKDGTLL